MPVYNFEKVAAETIEARGIKMYGSHKDLLWRIRKALENKEITPADIETRLKENKDFRFELKEEDYKKIKEATE